MAVTSAPAEHRLRRDVSRIGLLFISLGSIIGSGWLFGALTAATLAGPAALISWLLGGAVMILLALVHAELGGMFPVAGGSARFPQYAFGALAGFAGGWFAFLGAVTTAPIEVEAGLQYATNYLPGLTRTAGATPVLTPTGYAAAAALMLLFSIVNVLGVRWLSETNKATVWWKIAVPVLTVVVLMAVSFHPGNVHAGGGFMPFGVKGVLVAVTGGGIIFAYQGFEQAIQVGGETRDPQRNIPFAVIGSMVLGVVLYLALQVAFVAALAPADLAQGWAAVAFTGTGEVFGPFAGLAAALGLGWLAFLLYTDAVISPAGTALLYVGTSARLTYALGRQRHIPRVFARVTGRGTPLVAIGFSFLCGMVIFLPFPGWQQLVGFITSATVLAYASAPLALGALRRQVPDRPRPYRLPAAGVLAPLAFVVASEVILFTGWTVVWKLVVAVLVGVVLLALSRATTPPTERPELNWAAGAWLAPYLAGLAGLSYLGSFDTAAPSTVPVLGLAGPRNLLRSGWDLAAVAVLALAVYWLAMRLRLPDDRVREYTGRSDDEAWDLAGAP
ncbi:MAG TPA: APC family permease [Mycobacteriales bacterium]|nr:APC family permease [Mycobacteriales bacterium]